jgi:hypothetical protein
MLVMCDTSGWGVFKVMYEGCCVINTGSFLRVEQMEGRGWYTGAWWEWDCGSREGREIIVGIMEREDIQRANEKKERKKRSVEKPIELGSNKGIGLIKETMEETQFEDGADETRVVEDDRDSGM